MTNEQVVAVEECGVITAASWESLSRNLYRFPRARRILSASFPPFGRQTYAQNIAEMSMDFFHSRQLPRVSFRPTSISEVISLMAFDIQTGKGSYRSYFNNPQRKEIDIQAGYIVLTPKGVYVNPPRDKNGNPIVDEDLLKESLKRAEKVEGIFLDENEFGFAPEGTFERGEPSREGNFTGGELSMDTFVSGGLARVLEHTKRKVARNLRRTSFDGFDVLPKVNIKGFDRVDKPTLKIVNFTPSTTLDSNRYFCIGCSALDCDALGYAFGIYEDK